MGKNIDTTYKDIEERFQEKGQEKQLKDTNKLMTLMWANETFDPEHPDTFAEPV